MMERYEKLVESQRKHCNSEPNEAHRAHLNRLIHSSLNQKQREASGLLGNYPKCGTCLA